MSQFTGQIPINLFLQIITNSRHRDQNQTKTIRTFHKLVYTIYRSITFLNITWEFFTFLYARFNFANFFYLSDVMIIK